MEKSVSDKTAFGERIKNLVKALRTYSIRTIAFWFVTLIIAQELLAGSMWALLQNPFDKAQFTHLGYPFYMLFILGAWKLAGGLVILLPRLRRLKEWAYAGAIFDFSGAVLSHLFLGDGPQTWAYPAFLVGATLLSWRLRPDKRRLSSTYSQSAPTNITAWVVPIVIATAMILLTLLKMPKGISPSGTPAW